MVKPFVGGQACAELCVDEPGPVGGKCDSRALVAARDLAPISVVRRVQGVLRRRLGESPATEIDQRQSQG